MLRPYNGEFAQDSQYCPPAGRRGAESSPPLPTGKSRLDLCRRGDPIAQELDQQAHPVPGAALVQVGRALG
jgi:hypothetical protein